MECPRVECRREWEDLVSDEEENERGYREGGYSFVHCQSEGCHTIYPKGKNGWTCRKCQKEQCEYCSDEGKWKFDRYYCSKECCEKSNFI